MSSSTAVDPVRAQVEETLRQMVDTATAVPCEVLRRTRETATRAVDLVTDSVTTSIGVARTLGELTFGSLLGIGRSAAVPMTGFRAPAARPARSSSIPNEPAEPIASVESVESVEGATESDATTLPLDDYESLAASHVVARLARLSPDELVQIREFEEANRGRRTILGKIEQLLNA